MSYKEYFIQRLPLKLIIQMPNPTLNGNLIVVYLLGCVKVYRPHVWHVGVPHVFSRESDSTIANVRLVCPSVSLSQKLLSLSESSLSVIMPIS